MPTTLSTLCVICFPPISTATIGLIKHYSSTAHRPRRNPAKIPYIQRLSPPFNSTIISVPPIVSDFRSSIRSFERSTPSTQAPSRSPQPPTVSSPPQAPKSVSCPSISPHSSLCPPHHLPPRIITTEKETLTTYQA
jgi:hypothetical protein